MNLWLTAALFTALGWLWTTHDRLRIAQKLRELEQARNDDLSAKLMVVRAELQAIQQRLQEAARKS